MYGLVAWLSLAGAAPAQPPVFAPPQPAPVLVEAGPVPAGPLSVCEFVQHFKPCCGTHNVCLLHPKKCCPVNVCFTLPPGDPCVRVNKYSIVFDYGCQKVRIQFGLLCCRAFVVYC
jgi:hypothetical protein